MKHLAAAAGCTVKECVNTLLRYAADLEAIQKGLKDVKAGRVTPLVEFDQAFRKEMGFLSRAGD